MTAFIRSGDPFVWLAGSALVLCLLIIAGLVGVVLFNGLGFFWARDLVRVELSGVSMPWASLSTARSSLRAKRIIACS